MSSLAPEAASPIESWQALASELHVADGVHRPSTFSAFLAANLPDVSDASLVDAGSGAGLVTIAALSKGARHVVALDRDAAALENVHDNVRRILGTSVLRRLSLWRADWSCLGLVRADMAVANPPQRPLGLLKDLPPAERRLHDGGVDGLAAHRTLLAHARTQMLFLTASSLLPRSPRCLATHRYSRAQRVAAAPVSHHPVWISMSPQQSDQDRSGQRDPVAELWRFTIT